MYRSSKLPRGVTAPKGLWIDKNGVQYLLKEMEIKHIEAALAMLLRIGLNENHPKIVQFRKELRKRAELGDFYTGCTKDTTPFSLGIEGEEWSPELPALLVQLSKNKRALVTRMDTPSKPWAVAVGEGRLVQNDRRWFYFEDLIMAVAFVHAKRQAWGGDV